MQDIIITASLATAGNTLYVPVPCRGTVAGVRVVSSLQMDNDGTLKVSRGTDDVNQVTVPENTAAGGVLDGVPDSTNAHLVFDPDSDTAAERVIKIVTDSTFHGGNAQTTIHIKYDTGAYVKEDPLHA